jgi:hypothetical protein
MCPDQPLCPCVISRGHSAAHTLAVYPGQGWSLLGNGVIVFGAFGELLPGGRAVAPLTAHRPITLVA